MHLSAIARRTVASCTGASPGDRTLSRGEPVAAVLGPWKDDPGPLYVLLGPRMLEDDRRRAHTFLGRDEGTNDLSRWRQFALPPSIVDPPFFASLQ